MTSNLPPPSDPSIQWPAPFSRDEWFALTASVAFAGATGLEQSPDPDDPHIAYALAVIGVAAMRRALGEPAYLELKRMFEERADAEQKAAE